MAKTQIRNTQVLDLSIMDAQVATNANIALSKIAGSGELLKRDGTVPMTGNLDMNNFKIVNLATPTNPNDAANKAYVDSTAQGLDTKASCRVATTLNITLSAPQTVDGIAVIAGDRVLVKNQTTASANGIYVVAAGAWTRAIDANTSAKVNPGMFTFIEEGTNNADSGWVLTTDAPITLDTTALAFTQFSGAGQLTAGAGLLKTANTVDIQATNVSMAIAADSIAVAFDTTAANIELGTNGIRIKRGTSAQIMVANAAGDPQPVTMSGDASISNTGAVAIPTANTTTKGLLTATDWNTFNNKLGTGAISDIAFAASWDGVTTIAPSKNAVYDQLVLLAPLASPSFTGTPLAPTAAPATNTTQIATTAFVGAAISSAQAGAITVANFVRRETPGGLVNGVNTAYTLAFAPLLNSEHIYVNGVLQEPGAGNDYTITAGGAITFLYVLQTGDKLMASYLK